MSPSNPPRQPDFTSQAAPTRPSATGAAGALPNEQESALLTQLENISFLNPAVAYQQFVRVGEQVSSALRASLPALLAESPDPDSALMLVERLVSSSPEIPRLLDRNPSLAHYAVVVFGHSPFLGETLLHNADLLHSFLREKNLDRSFSREEFHESLARFRSRSFETDISLLLARFKRREYVRIMLRDVLKIAPLAETTAEISALADVLIEDALREAENRLQRRYGSPQHLDPAGRLVPTPFAVLSLGKLGGNELNYSSDVDLMYIFGDGQAPPEAHVSNREYFIRLAQQITEILSQVTSEGAVFRIDLRLRPQGNEGELAISVSHALEYYAGAAHDWERQALIKVRCSAGDSALARAFIRGVQPHVYTEKVNFAAIKTALVAREKMHARRPHKKALEPPAESINVKVDRGGIRDIEFLVQCLQRVYGGEEPWLRSGGTLFSLQKLHDKGHISGKEFHELNNAYEFLRHLEHRLQLRRGQQTHHLPASASELRILQCCMEGYSAGMDRVADLVETVRARMAAVAEVYQRIIYHQQTRRRQEESDTEFQLRGTLEPTIADESSHQILERLAIDAPNIYQAAIRRDPASQAQKNLYRFLSSAFTSSERYAAVVRNAHALDRALVVFENSDYLTDTLVRHPEEIATLAEWDKPRPRASSGRLFESDLSSGARTADPIFAYVASASLSYGEKLALLRQEYRHQVFASGARDINELRGVYESLTSTTAAAEDAIAAAFKIAHSPPGLAVMAVGRLGSSEFDVLSDADVIFVYEDGRDRQALAKSAELMMQALAAYTRDGMVFPVDARLRPRGGEGELLVTPVQLATYCEQEAQPWEALMYTKLRYLAGSRELAERTLAAARILFERSAMDPGFAEAVRDMRHRLEVADAPEKSLKTSPGAAYDIDFLSAYLLVKQGVRDKGGTLRDRLWRCVATGILDKADSATLDHAAELLRTVDHIVRLVVGRQRKWLPATEHARQVTEKLTAAILGREFPQGLEDELARTCTAVRDIYERVLA